MSYPSVAPGLASLVLFLVGVATGQSKRGVEGFEGFYRYRFNNRLMDGTPYQSENRLTVLKLSANSAYFLTHLDWANGHTCDLSGVAELDPTGAALVYRKPSLEDKVCVFRISRGKDRLVFSDDDGACRIISCGSRGMLATVEFKFKDRSVVKADRIRKSSEFTSTMAEHTHGTTSPPHRQ